MSSYLIKTIQVLEDTTANLQVNYRFEKSKQIDCDKCEQTADKKPASFVFLSHLETSSHHPWGCNYTPGINTTAQQCGDGKTHCKSRLPTCEQETFEAPVGNGSGTAGGCCSRLMPMNWARLCLHEGVSDLPVLRKKSAA